MSSSYLTVEQVAARYGVAKRTVHEWTCRGKIPFFKVPNGRRRLFDPAALAEWERSRGQA